MLSHHYFVAPQFTVRFRYSGVGIAYNLSNAIFAGTAPLIQTALVLQSHGDPDDALMVSPPLSLLLYVVLGRKTLLSQRKTHEYLWQI